MGERDSALGHLMHREQDGGGAVQGCVEAEVREGKDRGAAPRPPALGRHAKRSQRRHGVRCWPSRGQFFFFTGARAVGLVQREEGRNLAHEGREEKRKRFSEKARKKEKTKQR